MNTLDTVIVANLLGNLRQAAYDADHAHFEQVMAEIEASGEGAERWAARLLEDEKSGLRPVYQGYAEHFLSVSPDYGRFLYAMARAGKATRIIEFGTSMGISTIYLAAALRDNGGGTLIGSEFEPGKVARAREHLEAAGLADLVDIREGDARETLADIQGEVDLLLLDGAFSLYLPVLKLVEPHLRPGAIVLGENAFDPEYRAYVRDPGSGYLSQTLAIDAGRGNDFTVRIG
ncbi:class I SAM-dependent methyltransferase [Sphingomonas sp. HF-S4]|uniref:Class I SAM-dependent methyltransferase n=1 Tax=Sphingomonas agrestis TaxID=3080540 RepID=A0ABU3Y4E4_9SPHN|nr:class I SAM-dependent methyltransferase [Sphingomonas sp. HF-S4]MDV3456215.1 class I SAM-dependent methyltransferase [Sphingomonas sp. HF-S4]